MVLQKNGTTLKLCTPVYTIPVKELLLVRPNLIYSKPKDF